MPVMTKLYHVTGNELYLSKLYEYFKYAQSVMHDEETGLFYRDGNYVYPDHSTNSGQKDFWARGDGWVFAGLAKIIQDMPEDYEHRKFFIAIYTRMAESLKEIQQEEGYWTRSLLDPDYAPGYETSGSAFFTFGMAWGINFGLLPSDDYLGVVEKGWHYLHSIALQENGSVGYVQPIGASASPGTWVDAWSTANFGTGAFLLAASEVVHLASGEMPAPALLYMDSITLDSNTSLIIHFNDTLDIVSAEQLSNYTIDGITLNSAKVLEDKKSVNLSLEGLSIGKYNIMISGITSANNHYCEDGETLPFLYQGNYTISASAYEAGTSNTPDKTMDGDYNTRWSCEGDSVWLNFDLKEEQVVESIDIAFYNGDRREAYFAIELSQDGESYTRVHKGASSGTTWELEKYNLNNQLARHIKLVCFGNSRNLWNSITEVNITYSSKPSSIIPTKSEITAYPNPSQTGSFTIKGLIPSRTYFVRIINSFGHTVYLNTRYISGGKMEINKKLPQGIYNVICSMGSNRVYDTKLIVG